MSIGSRNSRDASDIANALLRDGGPAASAYAPAYAQARAAECLFYCDADGQARWQAVGAALRETGTARTE